jgi:50S ribosomal protein L16 3-hydroxylase
MDMLPTRFDVDGFLRDHWQKKPLLIRNPWAAWSNPIEPDELAGLACEDDVESRLVTLSSERWELEQGPLPEDRFGQLGKKPWTLLVQTVDHHVPAVAALLEPFRFIPNWRVDDVMVSYAVDGGGVGPHFDQYDVFLVQGLGRRRWQLGGLCDDTTELLPHDDLRLLANFEPTEEWILEPGDILYVPPRIAHNGMAVGDDCMTYSIGFRAPSRGELIGGWAESLLAQLDDDDRYADPDLPAQENPGEISAHAIARLHAMVTERMLDRDAFARWFAQYSTAPKNPEIDWRPEEPIGIEDLRAFLADGVPLLRNPASRFSFIQERTGSVLLFVDGQCFPCADEAAAFAERLCAHDRVVVDPAMIASGPTLELIAELFNRGSVAFDQQG